MDVVQLASELVQINSVNPGELAIATYVKELLVRMQATEVQWAEPAPGRPNVTGWFDFGARETILLEAHFDTVAVEGMAINPFGGRVENGRLWGRGACDVKGPMAAMLTAISEVATSKSAQYNVLFVGVCDEESGFLGVRHLVTNLSIPIRFAVVAEPTELHPLAGHKGVVRWQASARGIAAHSSTPQWGKNAIYETAEAVLRLRDFADELQRRNPHEKLGSPSLSVGLIRGGSAVNIVPEHCTIDIDRRLVPGEEPEQAQAELQGLLGKLELSEPLVAAPAFLASKASPAVQACLAAASKAGVTAEPDYANYCTDASFYGAAGIEAVVFGPGSIRQAHTKDEHIEVEALHHGAKAYQAILEGAT